MSHRSILSRVFIIVVSAVIVFTILQDQQAPESENQPVIRTTTVTPIPDFVPLPAPDNELLDNGQFSIQVGGHISRAGWITDDTFVTVSGDSPITFVGDVRTFLWNTKTMTYKFGIEGSDLQANAETGQLFLFASLPNYTDGTTNKLSVAKKMTPFKL